MLAGGMVAFGVHKMSASQAKQVEEHTGVPPEELEDEDLEAAMAELNIPKQELTDEDRGSRSWHRRIEAISASSRLNIEGPALRRAGPSRFRRLFS